MRLWWGIGVPIDSGAVALMPMVGQWWRWRIGDCAPVFWQIQSVDAQMIVAGYLDMFGMPVFRMSVFYRVRYVIRLTYCLARSILILSSHERQVR